MFNSVDCDICKFKFENPALYGEFIRGKKVDVHYYCLLSAFNIPQRGKTDKTGIFGFLEKDIQDSFKEFKDNQCWVCSGKHAAVKCAYKGCKKVWHYPCGRRSRAITQFTGKFSSYCSIHNPETNLLRHPGYIYCHVCYKLITTNHPASCILSKCCVDAPKYFPERSLEVIATECFTHADCVQRYTANAGYDSVCINCNMDGMNKEEWQEQMRLRGIFVPRRMAVWENDDYFKQQTKRKCENKNCKTPDATKNVWTCYICGCFPLHLKCAGVSSHEEYYCPKCFDQSFINLIPTTSKKK